MHGHVACVLIASLPPYRYTQCYLVGKKLLKQYRDCVRFTNFTETHWVCEDAASQQGLCSLVVFHGQNKFAH